MVCQAEIIKNEIDEIYEDIVGIRRYLHMYPELSEQEVNTSAFVAEKLDDMGIDYKSGIAGNGIIATIYGKNKDHAVAIRADMDALPLEEDVEVPFKSQNAGVMHGCGHDIHTAILLGTAFILKKISSQLPASVKLFFQPSEETVGGAKQMIDEGCLKTPNVKSVIGLHVTPEHPSGTIVIMSGPVNAASCEFSVSVIGCSCHGAHPDLGIDPLLPACTMVTSLQSIVTRRINPAEATLITVGKFNSGTKENIISGKADFSGIIRTFNLNTRRFIKEEIEKICKNTAEAYGATCQIEFKDSYPSLENDYTLYEMVRNIASQAIGEKNVIIRKTPNLGADDFAYFCHYARGMYIDIGSASHDVPSFPLHSEKFCPDEECIKTGILIEVLSAINILKDECEA